jgi:hypothetical protein
VQDEKRDIGDSGSAQTRQNAKQAATHNVQSLVVDKAFGIK